jgi:hypothetical protein
MDIAVWTDFDATVTERFNDVCFIRGAADNDVCFIMGAANNVEK